MHKVALFEIPNMHFKSQNRKKLQKMVVVVVVAVVGLAIVAAVVQEEGYIRIEERKTLEGL